MNRSTPENSEPSIDKTAYTNVLAAWTEASFDLFVNFKKIKQCLNQDTTSGEPERGQSSYIGQCPREPLAALFTDIGEELDGLLQELEHLNRGSQAEYKMKHARMIAQTVILNQLNQQARDKLFLATLSAT